MHAVGASQYSGRSHFEGQNILEAGNNIPYAKHTGWLGRALDLANASYQGTAMDLPIPLILRGAGNLESRSPSYFPPPSPDLLFELAKLNLTYFLAESPKLDPDTTATPNSSSAFSANLSPDNFVLLTLGKA